LTGDWQIVVGEHTTMPSLKQRILLILPVIAAVGCHHALPVLAPTARTPVGSWEGVLNAIDTTVANTIGPTLNIAVIIRQTGPGYSGRCSQRGGKLRPITNARIQSFELYGIDPAGNIVLLRGKCGGLPFELAYHPLFDQITGVTWMDRKYFNAGVMGEPNSGLQRTK
jgi:hypothetical protein